MIKGQCDKCKSKDTCQENKVFDDTSCPNYIRRFDLEKHTDDSEKNDRVDNVASPVSPTAASLYENLSQDNEEEMAFTSEGLKQTTTIHGWLATFLIWIVFGALVNLGISIFRFNPAEYGGSTMLALTDVVFSAVLCAVAFMTVYAFRQRKPNAVFLGKTYFVAIFVSNILFMKGSGFDTTALVSPTQTIRGTCIVAIAFAYLTFSDQVHEVIPKEFRTLSKKDYGLVATLIVVPLLFFFVGIFGLGLKTQKEKETAALVNETKLAKGELTDGRVVFTPPTGFACKKLEEKGLVYYTMESADGQTVTLCSDFEPNQSAINVNTYWKNFEDPQAPMTDSKLITSERKTINGFTYYYKEKRYVIGRAIVFWKFAMLFDNASSKVCIMSSYDQGDSDYFNDILKSIRFH